MSSAPARSPAGLVVLAASDLDEAGVVDIVLVEMDEREVSLERIVVPEDRRGEGLARRTVERLARCADEHGVVLYLEATPIAGETSTMSAAALSAFYERLGFSIVDPGQAYMERPPRRPIPTPGYG